MGEVHGVGEENRHLAPFTAQALLIV